MPCGVGCVSCRCAPSRPLALQRPKPHSYPCPSTATRQHTHVHAPCPSTRLPLLQLPAYDFCSGDVSVLEGFVGAVLAGGSVAAHAATALAYQENYQCPGVAQAVLEVLAARELTRVWGCQRARRACLRPGSPGSAQPPGRSSLLVMLLAGGAEHVTIVLEHAFSCRQGCAASRPQRLPPNL